MWPHKDLAWWGFVLSIAAIVLAYPLSLLANLTTPKLKDWWAKRSKSALQKRIEFLNKEKGEVEKWTGEMSVGEDLIMTTLWYVHSFVTASVHLLLTTSMLVIFIFLWQQPSWHKTLVLFVILLATVANLWRSRWSWKLPGEYHFLMSPVRQSYIKGQVAKLTDEYKRRYGDN